MRKLSSYMLLVIATFFLFGCISKTPEGYFDPIQNLSQWTPLAIVAIVISFILVGIAYMIAEFAKMPELNAWAKNEFYESLISTFFVGSVVAVLIFLNVFIAAVTLSTDVPTGPIGVPVVKNGEKVLPPHFEIAEDYLKEVDTRILDTYISLIIADQYIDALATLTLSFPVDPVAFVMRVNVALTPAAGLSMVSNSLITITDTLAIMDLVLVSQGILLKFIEETMFSIFLPLGVIFRAFPITRRLGSTVIALAITLYIVYPLTLGINHAVIKAVPPYEHLEKLDTKEFEQRTSQSDFAITQPPDQIVYTGNRALVEWHANGIPRLDPNDCSVIIKESGIRVPDVKCGRDKSIVITSEPLTLATFEPYRIYTFELTVNGKDANGNPFRCKDPSGNDVDCKDEVKIIVVPNCATQSKTYWGKCWFLTIFGGINKALGGGSFTMSFGGDTIADLGKRLLTSPWFLAPPLYNKVVFEWITSVLPHFGQLAAAVTLFTVIDIVICVTFFRSLSSSIGGESQLMGLARVI